MFAQFHGLRGIRNLAFLGLTLLVVFKFSGSCQRKPLAGVPGKPTPLPQVTLKPNEVKKIFVDTNKREITYAIRKADGTIETKVIEGVRRATITQTKDGIVTLIAKRWGFSLEPGLGFAIDQGPRPALDLRFFYFDRFGAIVGIYYRGTVRSYLGASYDLSRLRLVNTSLWVGMNPAQNEFVFGARLGF